MAAPCVANPALQNLDQASVALSRARSVLDLLYEYAVSGPNRLDVTAQSTIEAIAELLETSATQLNTVEIELRKGVRHA